MLAFLILARIRAESVLGEKTGSKFSIDCDGNICDNSDSVSSDAAIFIPTEVTAGSEYDDIVDDDVCINTGSSATDDDDWSAGVSTSLAGATITASIDADGATNYMNLDGNDNNVTFDGDGYAGQFFKLEHTGGSRTFNVNQQSTLDNDWLRIISNGSNGTVCVNQNDQGTSTSC